ncbi:MAG: hypothetical protein SFU85_00375 [Candidatus Methylacidiphilales bacterium]|nr:hypothetical protein [Candidatus Methylacidiphilales bacterium]
MRINASVTRLFLAAFLIQTPIHNQTQAADLNIKPEGCPTAVTLEAGGRKVPTLKFDPTATTLHFLPVAKEEQNWAGKSYLNLELFNSNPGQTEFVVLLRDGADTKAADLFPRVYFWTKVKADWQGWKTFSFRLDTFYPSTGATEASLSPPPVSIWQIIFSNQLGPSDPAVNTWGVPVPNGLDLGLGKISVSASPSYK